MGDDLVGRIARVTFATPVPTPGDYSGITLNVMTIDAGVNVQQDPNNIGLRILFDITKTDKKDPNTSKITVINLNSNSRGQLQVKPTKTLLDAGYTNTGLSRFFVGDARSIDHERKGSGGADWETVAKLGDGERAFRFARVSESFTPGTPQGNVLRYLAGASGLSLGNSNDIAAKLTSSFDQGYHCDGPWSSVFDKFIRSLGYTWSIQSETIQILDPGQSLALQIPLISPSTGLIGSPEMGTPEKPTKPHLVKFKSLLIPTQPGARVHLTSERYDADVRVKKCRFEGDTQGGPWFTHIEGVIIPGTSS